MLKCLLDMDGVLTDFMTAAHKEHNLSYDYEHYPYQLGEWDCCPPPQSGLSTRDFWDRLQHNFWASLPWHPDGKEILSIVEAFFGKENVCLLSSPTLSPESASGKIEWIQRELPEYSRRFLIGPAKQFCASHHNVLIDDGDHNLDKFYANGGISICVPRKWNQLHHITDSIQYLQNNLEYLFENYEERKL